MMTPNKKSKFLVSILCITGVLLVSCIVAETKWGSMTIFAARVFPQSWHVIHPLQSILDSLTRTTTLLQENQKLLEQNRKLLERIAAYEEHIAQTTFTTQTQDVIARSHIYDARVIGTIVGSGGKRIVINAGSEQGIRMHDWILVPERTLVGRIQTIGTHTSIVQTIFDPDLKITATVSNTKASGLFSFSNNTFLLDYVAETKSIPQGDLVLTSGQDGAFPKGFVLGITQSMITSAHTPLFAATVQSYVSIPALEYVMIVRNTLETLSD